MTAGIVQPIIPRTAPARTGTASTSRHPLPLAPVPPEPDRQPVMFGVATLDGSGRVAEATVLAALGWGAGTRLDIRVQSGLVLIAADPCAVFRMTARTRSASRPESVTCCGLSAGPRVLLTADPAAALGAGLLVVHPPAAIAAMVGQFHAAVLGGETR